MSEKYDGAGEQYAQYKESATLPLPERYTFMKVAGDLQGRDVIDLACGTGFYTRMLKQQGARRVVGVDISTDMIAQARQAEGAQPLGIEYHVQDALQLRPAGEFDLVTAVYLLNYASSREALLGMFRAVYGQLRENGRFVAQTTHPGFSLSKPNWTKYGLSVVRLEREHERFLCEAEFHVQPPLRMSCYNWDKAVYAWAAREAGFRRLSWHEMEIPPSELALRGAEYWRDYQENPLILALSCAK
jgi:SAM-dependent methyltransferase